jgi:hypothetical protein
LITISTALFIFSVFTKIDPITLGIIAGLNTIVYSWYFQSKNHQAILEQNQNNDPQTDRNPDEE